MRVNLRMMLVWAVAIAMATTAKAELFFSTGDPDGKIATATRPESAGHFEIESADDFVLTQETKINSASFTGLVTGPSPPSIGNVVVEIYRVFPADSNVGRTTGPPDFSTDRVPTRVNSPSDVALDSRDSASSTLTFTPSPLSNSFTALNSVQPGGIHPKPGQFTGGNGQVTGQEIRFDTSFTNPFDLQAGHYFFVPQVEVTSPGGNFLWLSAPKPIVAPGTPFSPDLQSWTRDDPGLNPDWLRIGTDITHQGPFNAAFSLSGTAVPEPSTLMMGGTAALAGLGYWWRRRRRAVA